MINWTQHYWYTVPCQRARIEELVRRAEGLVLDCGCSEGFLTKALLEKGLKVVSVDINDKALLKAKELFNIDVLKADVNNLPFQDEVFNLVIGGELLEHVDNPGKALSEMFRVSKGRVLISLPLGEYWLGCEDHKWQIEGVEIEHDKGIIKKIEKKLLILEFIRKR